ncbi:hypothetical protein IAU60_001229 [Kwoniella sp. DSM 27419]
MSSSSSTAHSPSPHTVAAMLNPAPPRPRSSPASSLHKTSLSNAQIRRAPAQQPHAPVPLAQPQPQKPIMVALAGWPEPIYVSSHPLFAGMGGTAGGSLEPLSTGQVYDGVNLSMVKPLPARVDSKAVLTATIRPLSLSSSPATTLDTSSYSDASSSSASSSTSSASSSGTTSPVMPSVVKVEVDAVSQPLAAAKSPKSPKSPIASAFSAGPSKSPTTPSKPAPAAPMLSIFATTCPHLTDPSLGPCPFKYHPHDIRNMFPPTSHLGRSPPTSTSRLASMPSLSAASLASTANDRAVAEELVMEMEDEKEAKEREMEELERRNPPGLTNYFPIPGAGAPKPRSATRPHVPKPSPSAWGAKTSGPKNDNSLGKRKGAFEDPRYGANASILHKGRALPVVPSWSSPPSSSPPSHHEEDVKGKGRQILQFAPEIYPRPSVRQKLDEPMDVDSVKLEP